MKHLTLDFKGNGYLVFPEPYDVAYCGPNKASPIELSIEEIVFLLWKIKKVKIVFDNLEIIDAYSNVASNFVAGAPQFFTYNAEPLDAESEKVLLQYSGNLTNAIQVNLPFTFNLTGYTDPLNGNCLIILYDFGRLSNTNPNKQFATLYVSLTTAVHTIHSVAPVPTNQLDISFFGLTLLLFSSDTIAGTFSIEAEELFAYN